MRILKSIGTDITLTKALTLDFDFVSSSCSNRYIANSLGANNLWQAIKIYKGFEIRFVNEIGVSMQKLSVLLL